MAAARAGEGREEQWVCGSAGARREGSGGAAGAMGWGAVRV